MTKRRSNWYIYLITFLVTGVLLYIVSNALLSSFYSEKDSQSNVSQHTGTVFKPDSSYNFTVLAALSKGSDDAPGYYMTITYRGDTNSIMLMPYLPESSFGGQNLKDAYAGGGADAVMKVLNSGLGLNITKYVRFTEATITEFFDSVGNTTLSVPKELKYENKSDGTLTIVNSGTYSFSGKQLYTYLTFPDFGTKDIQYVCKIHGSAISAFINQNFFDVSKDTLKGYADFISNFTDTNIKAEDFETKQQALLYSFKYAHDLCDYYVPYGESSDNSYVISETSINSIKDRILRED